MPIEVNQEHNHIERETVITGTGKPHLLRKLLNVQYELKAPKAQWNDFGKYNFRSCGDILEAVKPLLYREGLALTLEDDIEERGSRFYVKSTACLFDVDGDATISVNAYAREEDTKKGMDGSQITGASSSYARKYALGGLFDIDDNKDSDATNDGSDDKKKKTKEEIEAEEKLNKAIKEVVDFGSKIKSEGVPIEQIKGIVSTYNDGNQNPNSIKSVEACAKIKKELGALAKTATKTTEINKEKK